MLFKNVVAVPFLRAIVVVSLATPAREMFKLFDTSPSPLRASRNFSAIVMQVMADGSSCGEHMLPQYLGVIKVFDGT